MRQAAVPHVAVPQDIAGVGNYVPDRPRFRLETWNEYWACFRLMFPISAGKIAFSTNPAEFPRAFRDNQPWNLRSKGGGSCLCQSCENMEKHSTGRFAACRLLKKIKEQRSLASAPAAAGVGEEKEAEEEDTEEEEKEESDGGVSGSDDDGCVHSGDSDDDECCSGSSTDPAEARGGSMPDDDGAGSLRPHALGRRDGASERGLAADVGADAGAGADADIGPGVWLGRTAAFKDFNCLCSKKCGTKGKAQGIVFNKDGTAAAVQWYERVHGGTERRDSVQGEPAVDVFNSTELRLRGFIMEKRGLFYTAAKAAAAGAVSKVRLIPGRVLMLPRTDEAEAVFWCR